MKKRSIGFILMIFSVIFLAVSWFSYRTIEREVKTDCNVRVQRDLDKVLLGIDRELSVTEHTLQTLASSAFEHLGKIPDPQRLNEILTDFLRFNREISGIAIGFADELVPEYAQKNGLGFKVTCQSDSLYQTQLGNDRDFRTLDDWYSNTFAEGTPRWSVPFLNDSNQVVICYCLPLHNQDNSVVGVLSCSVQMSRLQRLINEFNPYSKAGVFVLDHNLGFIIHPVQQYVFSETLVTEYRNRGLDLNPELADDVRAGRRGSLEVKNETGRSLICFDKIRRANLSIMMDCPADEAYAMIDELRLMMMVTSLIGLLTLLAALGIMLYQRDQQERRMKELSERAYKEKIAEEQQEQQSLRQRADTDELTGMPTRFAGELTIRQMIDRHISGIYAIVELDHFKEFNVTYGRQMGDKLLVKAAAILREVYPDYQLMRLGGVQFSFYARGFFTPQQCQEVADRLFDALSSLKLEEAPDYHLSVSMGMAYYDGSGATTFDTMSAMADECVGRSRAFQEPHATSIIVEAH